MTQGYTAAKSTLAVDAWGITPSDTIDFEWFSRGIYVGVSGNVRVVMQEGGVVTFVAVPAGSVLPIRARRINATGTTADSLVGLL